jgi:LuxR family transcriptional regulator, maltose regulon positive regulatory protein
MSPQIEISGHGALAADIAAPLMMAKLTPPELRSWVVPRPRIDRSIEKGVQQGTLTVISGPPGAGKTTALAQWVAAGGRPVAWLAIDEYDNTPERFWRNLAAALTLAGVDVPAGGFAWAQEAPLMIASALAAQCPVQRPPVVLVLDDLHLIHAPEVATGLAYLLSHAKPALRVLVGTRSQQPLPLHQYLLTGDLTEIHAAQLAFTGPETRLLLERHHCAAYREALMPLVKRMEGWVAGLRFVAIALSGDSGGSGDSGASGRGDTGGSGGGGSGEKPVAAVDPGQVDQRISRYLISEAFDAQPPETRNALLRTSVPEQVTQDLARALLDPGHAPVSLPELAGANLFIQPAGGTWYKYHPVFRDALRARLADEDPDLLAELLRRTAHWHRETGQLAGAVRYAAAAGDGELAARIIVDELAVGRLLDPDGGRTLAQGLEDLPESVTQPRPGECAVHAALAVTRHDREAAAAWLGRADDLLNEPPAAEADEAHKANEADGEVASRLAATVVRIGLARSDGDLPMLARAADELERVLSRLPAGVLSGHQELALESLAVRGEAALWQGRFDDAERLLAQATSSAAPAATAATAATADQTPDRTADRAAIVGKIVGSMALAEALCGRLVRAAEFAVRATADPASPMEADPGTEPPPNVPADTALALVYLERGDAAGTRAALRRAEAGLRTQRDRAAASLASLVAAWQYLAEGRCDGAVAMLAQASEGWSPPAWLDRRLALAEARAQALAGDAAAALDAVDRCARHTADPDTVDLDTATARAYAWAAAGDVAAARRELGQVFEVTAADPARELDRVVLDALVLDARMRYEEGDRAAGRASLGRALRIARGEDVRLPFEMEHAWLFAVLRADPELARGYRALATDLARADLPAESGALRSLSSAMARPAMLEPLTDREQEVLKRVAQLLSTAEIAEELYISVNTVKTHLKSVHRKLAVTHRREAVRRARELNLL